MSSQSLAPPSLHLLGDPAGAAVSAQSKARSNLDFVPCAATFSILLYAQGSSVICVRHDTLHIERLFERHTEKITLLAVPTVDRDDLVVTYDEQNKAIVWDWTTGDERASFVSYERISAAAWIDNGNIAFGRA